MKKLLTCAGLLVALGLTAQTPKIELGIELSTENIEGLRALMKVIETAISKGE